MSGTPGADVMERVRTVALAGADDVTVGDLTGTPVRAVELDLAGDADGDAVTVTGTDGVDSADLAPGTISLVVL